MNGIIIGTTFSRCGAKLKNSTQGIAKLRVLNRFEIIPQRLRRDGHGFSAYQQKW